MIRTFAIAIVSVSTVLGICAPAQAEEHQHMHGMSMPTQNASTPLSDGTVKKLDKTKNRLTLAHGPLKNLDMPGMTMQFAVADPAMLAKLKEGDKVRFLAEDRKGDLVITRLEPAR